MINVMLRPGRRRCMHLIECPCAQAREPCLVCSRTADAKIFGWLIQVYSYINETAAEQFCMSSIVGGGPLYTVVLGANFHRAYYTVYAYDANTNSAQVRAA